MESRKWTPPQSTQPTHTLSPRSTFYSLLSQPRSVTAQGSRNKRRAESRKWTSSASNPAHPQPLSSVDFRRSTFCILIGQQPQFDNRDREILSRQSNNPVFDPGAGLSMSGENLLARITTDPAMPSTENGPVPLIRPRAFPGGPPIHRPPARHRQTPPGTSSVPRSAADASASSTSRAAETRGPGG